jgi:DNA replication protein DnaC
MELRRIDEASARSTKAQAETCPLCAGTGWKTIPAGVGASGEERNKDRRVARCDCQLQARAQTLLAAARIPKRHEHCELSNFEHEGLRPRAAYRAARRFVDDYPIDTIGLLLVGEAGVGKTHLAVGIAKALIREKGIECVFYDYADLLKQIQESYNPAVQTTELGLLRPVFEAEVLVLDDLGSVRPTEWRWDTIRLIVNTRYNDKRTTIITTNFADKPAAGAADPDAPRRSESFSTAQAAARKDTLGDRIGERMRSRLHEMCKVVKMEGPDYRQGAKKATQMEAS